jgi:hypothetical protein
MKKGMIPPGDIHQPIRVVNAQSTEQAPILFGEREIQQGNLKDVTAVAVSVLSAELTKKGAAVSQDASKVLNLSVTKVQYLPTLWGSRCQVQLAVETGEGYRETFIANNVGYSPGAVPRGASCDFAITKAVSRMFKDEQIMGYLSKQ